VEREENLQPGILFQANLPSNKALPRLALQRQDERNGKQAECAGREKGKERGYIFRHTVTRLWASGNLEGRPKRELGNQPIGVLKTQEER